MTYQESMRGRAREYLNEIPDGTDMSEYIMILAAISMMELLAIIADELHEINRRGENGETVQTGPDQTGT